MTHSLSSAPPSQTWSGHRALASLVAAVAVVVPGVAGVLVALAVPAVLGPATHGGAAKVLVWFAAVLGGVATTVAADRAMRRFLPLAVLLRLSLDFPDRAPSRLRMALRAGTLRNVHAQLAQVAARGVDGDPTEAARTILELMAALSRYDRRTRGHSERVRAFTDVIADQLHLPRLDRDRLRWAALLHDIGKLHVDVGVLNKAGRLDGEEWEAVRAHPHVGARIAAPLLPWLGEWGEAIEHHHERWDGGGYPKGIAGTDIPLGARVVAVADAFEVMTATRSYKRPMSVDAARNELLSCAGTQFDPQVVRALLEASLTRLRWIVGPAALVAVLTRTGTASGAAGLRGRLQDVPLIRAAVAAAFAALSLPAVDVPLGTGEVAEADDAASAVRPPVATVESPGSGGGLATATATGAASASASGPSAGRGVAGAATARAAAMAPFEDVLVGTGWPVFRLDPATGALAPLTTAPATDPSVPTPASPDGNVPTPVPTTADATAASTADVPRRRGSVGRASTTPPGSIVSAVARNAEGGPGHGATVSSTAHATPKPSGGR